VPSPRPDHPTSSAEAVAPGEFRLVAFVDESMRHTPDNRGMYLLAAVVCASTSCDPVREMLRSLLDRRQPRLHWHAEDEAKKAKIAAAIGEIDLASTVVIGMPLANSKQERARRKCLEALLPALEETGVSQVYIESRENRGNRRDIQVIDALRTKGLISAGIRADHALPLEEPMLWLPDAVAGAVRAARNGQGEWLAMIGAVQQIEVSTL
jgi:hypothetical protein